ncbi:hypothetical protein J2Y86_002706 [Pseudomonas migulae]|uniref:hypothetical protein n=1 Tax=Pseudomonas migulae TaxID=78543 RepID=UPI00209FD0DE|nr:hypothetical protein [Pseudomonas migulae]MCP1497999.1 hypothetical protein [Pseudomonas migulae]
MTQIKVEESLRNPFSVVDRDAVLLAYNNVFLRGVKGELAQDLQEALRCGLIDELVSKRMIPGTLKSEVDIEGYDLVLSHEKLEFVSYPHEWSFSMLRDAAYLVLNISEIAHKYGFQLKDPHSYNIVFDANKPVFVDVGSLVRSRVPASKAKISTYQEFLSCYYYPLYLWSKGDIFTARKWMQRWKIMTPVESFVSYRFGFAPRKLKELLARFYRYDARLQSYGNGRVLTGLADTLVRALPWRDKATLTSLRKRLGSLEQPKVKSAWGEYHGMYDVQSAFHKRISTIADLAAELAPVSVVDIAGNQGVVLSEVAKRMNLGKATCVDYDVQAIENGYIKAKDDGRLNYAVVNPFYPECNNFETQPSSRFSSELVMALAVTHHLFLGQGYDINYVFGKIAEYSTRYVMIEFMPLGLYSSVTRKGTTPPDWYTCDWFRENFETHFRVLNILELEENRTLFIGELPDKKER